MAPTTRAVGPDRHASAEYDITTPTIGTQARELASGRSELRQAGGRRPVCYRRERLVRGERRPGDLSSVHPREHDEMAAGVDDRDRHERLLGLGGG